MIMGKGVPIKVADECIYNERERERAAVWE